jgi:hypothetical protein
MGTRYVQRIDDGRLRAVTDHVHAWLNASTKEPKQQGKGDDKPSLRLVGSNITRARA